MAVPIYTSNNDDPFKGASAPSLQEIEDESLISPYLRIAYANTENRLDRWIKDHHDLWYSHPITDRSFLVSALKYGKIRLYQDEYKLRRGRVVPISFDGGAPKCFQLPELAPDDVAELDKCMKCFEKKEAAYGSKFKIDDRIHTFSVTFFDKVRIPSNNGKVSFKFSFNKILDSICTKYLRAGVNVSPSIIMLAYDEQRIKKGMGGIDHHLYETLKAYPWITIYKLDEIRDKYLRIEGTCLSSRNQFLFKYRSIECKNESEEDSIARHRQRPAALQPARSHVS